MEITQKNFKEKLPLVEKAIKEAIFVAIDGEFTGLNAYKGISPFDTPSDRYDKLQESSKQFLLIQFGLCTFHYDKDKDLYTNQAFNFYVWPRPYNRSAPDTRFMCQTSSLDFLSSQHFDFNKLFKEGVSYLLPSEERKLRDQIEERQRNKNNHESSFNASFSSNSPMGEIAVPTEQQEFLKDIHEKVEKFKSQQADKLDLPKCNSFQRRLIYQTVKQKFTDIFLESVMVNNRDRVIRLHRVSSENDVKRKEEEKDQAEFDALDEAIGFSRVIRKLSESKKLVVGHNMILDICHTLNQFVERLPENYLDFKALCQNTFPSILDTKLMASTYPFKEEIQNSSLEGLKGTISELPYELPEIGPTNPDSGYSLGSEKYHEAGYDAYITGLCFIAMSNRLGKLSQDKDTKNKKTGTSRVLPDSHLIAPFLNKMYLMRINDIPYMNLSGEDLDPVRDHVFHITFPSEWKTGDIINLFSAFGPVFVSWLDERNAFVSLNIKENSHSVMKTLNSSNLYSVMPYKQYKAFDRIHHQQSKTGITPMMENTSVLGSFFASPPSRNLSTQVAKNNKMSAESKKRSASPPTETYKRTRGVTEDEATPKKPFEEPAWD